MSRPRMRSQGGASGFTLLEVILILAIIGVLTAIAVPSMTEYANRARCTRAKEEIRGLQTRISLHVEEEGRFPDTLSQLGGEVPNDPWGIPYQYLRIAGQPPSIRGKVRKDRFLVPLNSDYDLYSKGADMRSTPPLTAADSHDDVIRANDGGYIGLATNY